MAHTRFASTPDIMKLPALDDWVLMVNIARQCGAPVLLPRALAVCCRHLQPSSLVLNNATKEKLSLEDRALIADASQKLSQSLRETVHQPIYYPMQEDFFHCENIATCRPAIAKVMKELDPNLLYWFLKNGPYREVLENRYPDLCTSCIARWESAFTKGSKEIWAKLPSYFGLPPWDALQKQSGL